MVRKSTRLSDAKVKNGRVMRKSTHRSMPATADLAEEMNAVLSKVDAVAAQEVPLL